MALNTIDLQFADGAYTFAYGLERMEELQQKCKIGIGGLLGRLLKGCIKHPVTGEIMVNAAAGEFYAVDIIETIRQGLIGGRKGVVDGVEIEVTPVVANQLIQNYVLCRPLAESWSLAASALGACIMGYEPPKKDDAGDEPAPETAAPTEQMTTDASTTS